MSSDHKEQRLKKKELRDNNIVTMFNSLRGEVSTYTEVFKIIADKFSLHPETIKAVLIRRGVYKPQPGAGRIKRYKAMAESYFIGHNSLDHICHEFKLSEHDAKKYLIKFGVGMPGYNEFVRRNSAVNNASSTSLCIKVKYKDAVNLNVAAPLDPTPSYIEVRKSMLLIYFAPDTPVISALTVIPALVSKQGVISISADMPA